MFLLATAACLIVAGGGPFATAAMVRPAGNPAAASSEAVMRRFYGAVNETIATNRTARIRTNADGMTRSQPAGRLDGGDGAMVERDTTATMRDPGDDAATVLVVALRPSR